MTSSPERLQVIGLTGPADAGKDTVARLLVTHCGFHSLAFADALRAEICNAFRLDPVYLVHRATKETPMRALALDRCLDTAFIGRVVDAHRQQGQACEVSAPRSPREILRWWGTEYRRAVDPRYWVTAVDRFIADDTASRIVLSDVRFPNEAALIRSYGGKIWQIRRPGREAVPAAHVSETTGAEFAPDVVLDNQHDIRHLQGLVLDAFAEGALA